MHSLWELSAPEGEGVYSICLGGIVQLGLWDPYPILDHVQLY